MSFFSSLWSILEHIPSLIVVFPYSCLHWLWAQAGNLLYWFGVYSFKLQYWLMPPCCKETLDEILSTEKPVD